MSFPTFNVDAFDYNKPFRMFVAEASDLGIPAGIRYGQVQLHNPKTGNSVIFYLATRTIERDIYATMYKGVKIRVCIIND